MPGVYKVWGKGGMLYLVWMRVWWWWDKGGISGYRVSAVVG